MKFNRNSWHRKLTEFVFDKECPVSICPYFWRVMAALVVFISILPFALWTKYADDDLDLELPVSSAFFIFPIVTIITAAFGVGTLDGMGIIDVEGLGRPALIFLPALILGASWCFMIGGVAVLLIIGCLVFGSIELVKLIKAAYRAKFSNHTNTQPSSPSLIGTYFKAVKDKVCPMIEWED